MRARIAFRAAAWIAVQADQLWGESGGRRLERQRVSLRSLSTTSRTPPAAILAIRSPVWVYGGLS